MLKNSIGTIIAKKEIEYGLMVYEKIQSEYNGFQPLDENVVFMELFDNYYHLREERKQFKDLSKKLLFFKKFDEYKNAIKNGGNVPFETVINDISNITGECEGVFATKIYHTLYNDQPILDSVLAGHFKISTRHYTCKTLDDRIKYFIDAYDKYITKFKDYYCFDPEAKMIINEFDRAYPSLISDVKKIDLVLWADR